MNQRLQHIVEHYDEMCIGSAKKKSTVVNDRAQFSVGTMRSHRWNLC